MAAAAYEPPVADYEFLYREVFGRDIVADASGGEMDADDAAGILAAAGEFATEVLLPLDTVGDRVGAQLVNGQVRMPEGFAEAYRALVDAGWVTAEAPASAGGDGLPASVQAGLGELWNASNAAFALCWMLGAGAIHALDAAASDELRETYLTKLVSGEWTGSMNLTEPQAGSDLGAVRTMATPNGDGTWSIRGEKIFITWGDHDIAENIVHLVLARTPDAPEGAKGLSLFVAPRVLVEADGSLGERNRIETVAVEHKLGIHASPTCALSYDGATGYLVGELHGGLAGMFVMMNSARVGMGHQATGIADRAYQAAAAYAHERQQGAVHGRPAGTPIAEHPDVRRLLRSMSSEIFAMRALAVHVGDLFDRAERDGTLELAEFFVPILKGWTSEEAVRLTSDAIQVYGGMGFVEETGAAQHYRDARIVPIYEGTTAIQANDLIGRKVLRNGGATAAKLFAAIDETIAELRGSGHEASAGVADRLERAVAAARQATEALVGFADSPRDAYAVAVPYLMLLGTLAELRGSGHEASAGVADRLERAVGSARQATEALVGFADSPRDAYAAAVPYLMLLGTLAGGWMHGLAVTTVLRQHGSAAADEPRISDAAFYAAHHLSRVHGLAETVVAGEID